MKLAIDRHIVMNHKKIQRMMREERLQARLRRRNPYKDIQRKGAEHRSTDNILNRQFGGVLPRQVLATDITYLKFYGRFVYLSVVKDIGSGEVVAWYLDRSLHLPLVLHTLAQLDITVYAGAMIHSDQGWHYTHPRYIAEVEHHGFVRSMSRKGNCIDNAPMESFFGHFKDEIDITECRSFEELALCIDDYMHYYNHHRPQWNKNKMTPVQYRDHMISSM